MLRVAGRRLSSLSWLSAQPSSAALSSRNPFSLAHSSSKSVFSPADSFPCLIRGFPSNAIAPGLDIGLISDLPTVAAIKNHTSKIVYVEHNHERYHKGPAPYNLEVPTYSFMDEYKLMIGHNHFGLFAPLGSKHAAAQQPGSARRFYRREKEPSTTPDRNRNIRDYKRRLLAAKYELRRKLYKALCRDPDLPSAIRVKSRCKLSKLPRNSSFVRVTNRCIFSGRSRAVYKKFRMSRIIFRTMANQGQLMGIKKASW